MFLSFPPISFTLSFASSLSYCSFRLLLSTSLLGHPRVCFQPTPLLRCAAQQGHVHCLEWLHDVDRHGSTFNHKTSSGSVAATLWTPNHRGVTPLCAAAQMGHVEACGWLFQRARECAGGSVALAQQQAMKARAAAKVAVAHEEKRYAQAAYERWLAGQAHLVTLEEHAAVCLAQARSQEVKKRRRSCSCVRSAIDS